MRTKLVFAIMIAASAAYGTAINSPAELVDILGGPGTIDNFSNFAVAPGSSTALTCTNLTSSSTCGTSATNLVTAGVEFTFGTGGGQWDGVGWYGATTEEIVSRESTTAPTTMQPLTITFSTMVTALGFDIRAFSGYPATATVTFYGTNDSTILGTISNIDLNSDGASVFEGWEDTGGIGKVVITQTGQYWSPALNFLEYGAPLDPVDPVDPVVTPEPGSLALLGSGLFGLCWFGFRRKGFALRRND